MEAKVEEAEAKTKELSRVMSEIREMQNDKTLPVTLRVTLQDSHVTVEMPIQCAPAAPVGTATRATNQARQAQDGGESFELSWKGFPKAVCLMCLVSFGFVSYNM